MNKNQAIIGDGPLEVPGLLTFGLDKNIKATGCKHDAVKPVDVSNCRDTNLEKISGGFIVKKQWKPIT